jgi:hypothetical protein
MGGKVLREIEVSLLSALLKDGLLARDLTKAGLRPDLLPSPAGRELARLVLRVRDAGGDVTQSVEAQIADVGPLEAEAVRLLDLARSTPCPAREQALAYLALLEISEASERLRATVARADEHFGGWPPATTKSKARDSAPEAPPSQLRRVHLPDPTAPLPTEPPERRRPEAD